MATEPATREERKAAKDRIVARLRYVGVANPSFHDLSEAEILFDVELNRLKKALRPDNRRRCSHCGIWLRTGARSTAYSASDRYCKICKSEHNTKTGKHYKKLKNLLRRRVLMQDPARKEARRAAWRKWARKQRSRR